MPQLDPLPPTEPQALAEALLSELAAARLGLPDLALVAMTEPVARYRISIPEVERGGGLDELVYHWGWRFYLARADRLLPHGIDVRGPSQTRAARTGLVSGPQLARQAQLLDRLDRRADVTATLRLLDAPGLDWSGLWLREGDDDAIIGLRSGRTLRVDRLLGQLRRTAARQRRAARLRAKS